MRSVLQLMCLCEGGTYACLCVDLVVWLLTWLLYFFFFKQKTAYEMRISDWSSDVCSSDLLGRGVPAGAGSVGAGPRPGRAARAVRSRRARGSGRPGPEIGRASCRERVCQYV